jgi:hypothetical protein
MKPHKDGGQIWGGNRKRTAAIQERKNVRGHGDNKTRNILKDKQTEEEAVELQRPKSKLEREYSGKKRTSPQFHLACLVLVFLAIVIKAHTTAPRCLSLNAAFQEPADSYVLSTSFHKVRHAYDSWLNSGQLYFEPSMKGEWKPCMKHTTYMYVHIEKIYITARHDPGRN